MRISNRLASKKIQGIAGNLGVQVLRRTVNDITEFTVISYWESRDAIRKFAGADVEKTHNLPKDPEYLLNLSQKLRTTKWCSTSGSNDNRRI